MQWSATFQGDVVPAPTWRQALSPWWWVQDQEMAWGWADTVRRQPFANLFAVILGVAHRKRLWINTMDGGNFPLHGWGFAWLLADSALIPRPWIAYTGLLPGLRLWYVIPVPTLAQRECGAGWKSHGGFGVNWRRAQATNAGSEYHR
jgi:hypothetical protein